MFPCPTTVLFGEIHFQRVEYDFPTKDLLQIHLFQRPEQDSKGGGRRGRIKAYASVGKRVFFGGGDCEALTKEMAFPVVENLPSLPPPTTPTPTHTYSSQ